MAVRLGSVTSNGDWMDHPRTTDNEQEKEKELVVVTWVDILQTADWTPAEDVTIPTMQSVGWFISRDEKEIKIGSTRVVQSADDPQGTPFSITAFPIGCVEEIKSI
jgi:hypothetical protein